MWSWEIFGGDWIGCFAALRDAFPGGPLDGLHKTKTFLFEKPIFVSRVVLVCKHPDDPKNKKTFAVLQRFLFCRGDWIRTSDLQLPKLAR